MAGNEGEPLPKTFLGTGYQLKPRYQPRGERVESFPSTAFLIISEQGSKQQAACCFSGMDLVWEVIIFNTEPVSSLSECCRFQIISCESNSFLGLMLFLASFPRSWFYKSLKYRLKEELVTFFEQVTVRIQDKE